VVQLQYPCDDVVPVEDEPHHRLVIANEFVRFFVVEIATLERTLCHHHAHPYLMYVMGEAEIVSAPHDGEPKTLTYHDGDCELSSAGLKHVVENVRETKFRNLLVELTPGLNELQRGSEPRIVAGNGTVQAIFQEERISVWSLEVNPGVQVEVYGEAIFATLFEETPLPKHPGDITVKRHQVSEISWIPSCRGLLRSDLDRSWRVILFQLGRTAEQLAPVRKRVCEPLKSLRTHALEPE
jgi:hypothetical protein